MSASCTGTDIVQTEVQHVFFVPDCQIFTIYVFVVGDFMAFVLSFALLWLACVAAVPGVVTYDSLKHQPYNVSFDKRSFRINNEATLLFSAGVHYVRSTPKMWKDILSSARADGHTMVQTYVFWNAHERNKGQLEFGGCAVSAAKLFIVSAPRSPLLRTSARQRTQHRHRRQHEPHSLLVRVQGSWTFCYAAHRPVHMRGVELWRPPILADDHS